MITIKNSEEIKIMREGGRLLAKIVRELENKIMAGIETREIDREAKKLIISYGAEPAFLGYDGFPATICASVNQVVVHGIPSGYQLRKGDLFSLDIGLIWRGYYTDMARTYIVGGSQAVSPEVLRLVKVTRKSLKLGIKKLVPGNTIGDIGNTIQRYIEGQGFSVIRHLCGHGIGKDLHEDPEIPNFGKRHKGEKIKEGMVFCLEPMVSMGDWRLKQSNDGFGFEPVDESLTAHFEDMILIAKNGPEVLTRLPEEE